MKILCIDLKSFYASVECVMRGIDPFQVNLAVADRGRGLGSIVLAVSPHLKSLGAQSRCRIYDLERYPDVIYAMPRMRKYMDFACQVYNAYLEFVAPEDVHIYSIDEAFLDITHYLQYYHWTPQEFATAILQKIFTNTGLVATCGIGDNMFQAKVALDCFAKSAPNYIATLNDDDFIEKTKDLRPINQIWGIGGRIQKRLHFLNIHCLNDIIHMGAEVLRKEFGVIGEELFQHAQGIDTTTVTEARNYKPQSKSFGHSQIMFEDYSVADMHTILMEHIDILATELVMKRLQCQVICLGIGYSKEHHRGFGRQMKLPTPTNSREVLLEAFTKLYYKNVEDLPIRIIGARVTQLTQEAHHQWNLFDNCERREKEHHLFDAIGRIQSRYGIKAINMSISYLPKATKIMRSHLIGGHNAES
jgi:DNA polymerase V